MAVPDDTQGPLFLRAQDTIVRLTDEGALSYTSQVVRILQSQALVAGDIAIAWNPAAGQPKVHSLTIRRGNRVIDVLEDTSFEILRREDQLETAMLDGLLTAVLQVPDLRVGDDLEIAFTVPIHDPTLGPESYGLLFLNDAPPPGRVRLGLSWDTGEKPIIRMTDEFKSVAERTDNSLTLAFDNPGISSPPRNAPPRYAWSRLLGRRLISSDP